MNQLGAAMGIYKGPHFSLLPGRKKHVLIMHDSYFLYIFKHFLIITDIKNNVVVYIRT